ncbi:pyruvate dehydrogenase phosphatase regulatory subunit, mitochondrial isoform X2 [Mustela nigripes]|uniref:pyruvate dehydrogenase phosphatase regulatory subunit, mitochondrial isoform X2 n=1 Tax=Mustela nigripes TaxID=77151 RepID=UPI0028159DB3|nr:pyruvate dehydrogenase phosphatase regulatory subunit, mitochondrial isoform X2 [Mustela nigripes]
MAFPFHRIPTLAKRRLACKSWIKTECLGTGSGWLCSCRGEMPGEELEEGREEAVALCPVDEPGVPPPPTVSSDLAGLPLERRGLSEDEPLLSSLLRRMPDLETLEILKLVNCPETFTPDMRCIMGESPSVRGYFVLAGMNSAGLSFGGGAGR